MSAGTTATTGGGLRGWARDLGMGVRFAVGGGREGWIRTLLTALGVGLGVALLLTASSLPAIQAHRAERRLAAQPTDTGRALPPTASTLVAADLHTLFRGRPVAGAMLRPDGPEAPAPPGADALPKPGEMVLSPALRELLAEPANALLRERLPYKDAGTIGPAGLVGPADLTYYLGSATLSPDTGGRRVSGFGASRQSDPLDPKLLALIIVACVVLLVPVALFIATAVRFPPIQGDFLTLPLLKEGDSHGSRR
ncbi:hypothetical protein ACFVT2_17760 [Streptomyces sp. NPDC058000]|uniref:hypothetical protein n=1 Tax=Streptomyces sp. NPDC058000 TaxID=3346299 RepID=UPI0036EE9BEB